MNAIPSLTYPNGVRCDRRAAPVRGTDMQRLNLGWFARLGLALAAVVFRPDDMDVLKRAMAFYHYLADPKISWLDLKATRPHVWAIMDEINVLHLASDEDRPALLAARKATIRDSPKG